MKVRTFLFGAATIACMPTAALAASITYDISDTVEALTITGTITTDGTIGALGLGNITNWSVTENDSGTGTITFSKGDTGASLNILGNDLTASLSSISFHFEDFTNAADFVFLFVTGFANNDKFEGLTYTECNIVSSCSLDQGALSGTLTSSGGGSTYSAGNEYSTPQVIATVASGSCDLDAVCATTTPLPSTWLMLIAGFVGLGFLVYRSTKIIPFTIATT
jgi:hypothetical protein